VAQPSEQQLIAALDIGSSKVSALIVARGEDGRLTVLGTGQRESRGVKRGYRSARKPRGQARLHHRHGRE